MDITMNAQVCAETDIGLKREQNEDCYLIINRKTEDVDIQSDGMMFAVADGMGGHAGGEIASKMACQGMADYYSEKTDRPEGSDYFKARLGQLSSGIYNVHNKIIEYGRINREYEDMGTTLSVLVLTKNRALIAHVGDSRIYRLRQGFLEQLTEDHSMAQLFIEMGYLTPEKVANHPIRHVLSQAVGQGVENIFLKSEKVERGDTFLLCSDGLYDMVPDKEIRDILLNKPALNDKSSRLVARSLKRGGKDNVTVMVIQV
jgi:serine/threonine protein phosphatase PrpC